MARVTGSWSHSEVEAFLETTTVPIRLACRTPAGGLWMLSLWYRYDDGRLACATSADADIVEYLRTDDGVAFEVSVNEVPYRGVRGSGTVDIEPDTDKETLETLFDRYLGGTDSPLADTLLAEDREEVRLLIEPDRLHSWDFSGRMSAPEDQRA
jgi:nitroimidazol reductase NimA-like FMN-containing flavoprotein (pyridoxamine 5'-phosphate oxidase superfamily)